jgi:arabinogalactan oligomer/maltooligosaccharide transport system substrate-binding protein
MKNRSLLLVGLMLVLSMVLAACGGTAATPTAQPGGETVAPTEAPAEEPMEEATEVPAEEPAEEPAGSDTTLLIWADEARASVLGPIVEGFEEEFGVTVEIQQLQFGDIRDQLGVAGPAGEGPDILLGAHDWMGQLVVNGLVAPIDLGDKEDLFVENAISAMSYNGQLYGMPVQTENVALVRNTDLVPDAPATWEELTAACDAIADQIEVCLAQQQGDPYHFFGIQSSFGGRVFGTTDDGSYDPEQVAIDSEGSLAAAEFFEGLVADGYVVAGTDGQTAEGLFDNGQAAFMITGPWAIGRLTEAGVAHEFSAIPAGTEPAAPFLGVQGFMVSAFSEDPILAQTFLTEYVATDEVMAALVSADPRPSAYIPVRETQDDPTLAAFGEAGANALPMPSIPEMGSVWSSWGDALTLIQTGGEAADVAFTNAAEQIRTTIAGE